MLSSSLCRIERYLSMQVKVHCMKLSQQTNHSLFKTIHLYIGRNVCRSFVTDVNKVFFVAFYFIIKIIEGIHEEKYEN